MLVIKGLYLVIYQKIFFSVEDTNESNSVKLNNEIPKESKNVTADEGIEADNELDDFNEEEDYIKFLQKENMSPMIPKAKSNKLPLPVVTCEWTDKKSANNAPIYRPGLGIVPLYFS